MALNTKRKGKKVLFANEHQTKVNDNVLNTSAGVVNTGHNEVTAVHNFSANVNANCEHVAMPTVNNVSEGDDDFNYDDPILAALIDKNSDEETVVRNSTTDLIANVEAINECLRWLLIKHLTKRKR
ncbi:hypothetical protein Salat_0635200 [Sesamum alatum]|uniref:Uncharacterized protein n=1 Tax=Sesamum alatum TaxID=300844 RepID=A0AAE1YR54_9LAMI|nr:hypothetical protein Salat_0635200 [Sesamum alatum]